MFPPHTTCCKGISSLQTEHGTLQHLTVVHLVIASAVLSLLTEMVRLISTPLWYQWGLVGSPCGWCDIDLQDDNCLKWYTRQ